MTEDRNTKPLTEAQQNHLQALNNAFRQARRRMNAFIAYLQAEHDAPAPEWELRNLQVGFQRIQKEREAIHDENH